jgi:death-on-curing family protein
MKKQVLKNQDNKGEIVIYRDAKDGARVEVRFEEETLWVTQTQIADLFEIQRPAITKHLNNIFKSGELSKKSVSSILEHTASDSKKYKTLFYSLDAVLSVGYRVNSKRATQFRIWANKILKNYLVHGYSINEKRLLEAKEKFEDLQQVIAFLKTKSERELLKDQSGQILSLLSSYSKTLSVLNEYDKGTIKEIKGKKSTFVLSYENCSEIIKEIRADLSNKGEAGDLFGNERDKSFAGIVKGIYQTFSGKELYKTIEDKSAHLLYFIIKDHPFSDGNKRIAAFTFVYFLDKNNYLYKSSGEKKINDNALVALALLVAESNPKEKEIMIKIIKHLLV